MPCLIDSEHGGSTPSELHEKIRKARKTYRCCECGCTISPGERYEYASGRWDGEYDQYRTCLPCREIRNRFMAVWTYTALWSDLSECAPDLCMGDISGLSVEAVAKLEDQFSEIWNEITCEQECGDWCRYFQIGPPRDFVCYGTPQPVGSIQS